MVEKVKLPLVGALERKGLGRREVLQGLMGSAGAVFVIPVLADGHPIQQHLRDHAKVAAADAKANVPEAEPEFLDAHQLETLISLAERILPRSTEAKVAPFIDQLLAVDTRDNQREFSNCLGIFDGESIARYGHPWRALTAEQQVELLTAASTAKPSRTWTPPRSALTSPLSSAPPTLRDWFDRLKGWIVGAYYSSEIGMRELGWTGNMFFTSFPGCEHPGGHS